MFQIFIYLFLTLAYSGARNLEGSDERHERFLYLIPSSGDFAFYKKYLENGGNEVVYDCSVGTVSQGEISIFDPKHPLDTETLKIENCHNVTLNFEAPTERSYPNSIKVINVEYFRVKSCDRPNYETVPFRKGLNFFSTDGIKLTLNDIQKFDNVACSYNDYYGSRGIEKKRFFDSYIKTIVLENLTVEHLEPGLIPSEVEKVYMKKVRISNVRKNAVKFSHTGRNNFLSITDSHFGKLENGSFSIKVTKLEIQRNQFEKIENDAFSGTAEDHFLFEDNYVKHFGSISVRTPNLKIVNNTLDFVQKSFFKNFTLNDDAFTLNQFNFSENSVSYPPSEFFQFVRNFPTTIDLKNNRFNCSCAQAGWLSKDHAHTQKIIMKIFIDKFSNNVCVNYGNCGIKKFLNGINDACLGKFVCPIEDEEYEDETFTKHSMKSILNYLAKISLKLTDLNRMINVTLVEPKVYIPASEN